MVSSDFGLVMWSKMLTLMSFMGIHVVGGSGKVNVGPSNSTSTKLGYEWGFIREWAWSFETTPGIYYY